MVGGLLFIVVGMFVARRGSNLVSDFGGAGKLVPVLEKQMTEGPILQAVYPHRRHLAGKVRALIDHLVDWFATNPVR